MKKRANPLLLCLCAVLLVVVSVVGTLAYLTATDTVENTFTVGGVDIVLDEADVNAYGIKATDARVEHNEYKLIPGHTYIKDPTVHVGEDSEDCWLFVKLENEIAAIEGDESVAAQMAENGWTPLTEGGNVYAYNTSVSAGDDIVVFESFTVSGEVVRDVLDGYAGKSITVTAYAVQKDGFASAADAWTAADLG